VIKKTLLTQPIYI